MRYACSRQHGTAWIVTDRRIDPIGVLAPGPEKVIQWPYRYLDRDERIAVLLWGVAETWKAQGRSVRGFIRDMGWEEAPSTYHRRRKRGLRTIAEALTRDAIAPFSL